LINVNRFREYRSNKTIYNYQMDLPAGTALSLTRRKVQPIPYHAQLQSSNPDQLDCGFYVKAYKDVNPRFTTPSTHYYTIGKQEDRLPNEAKFRELYPLFDLNEYVNQNPDLARLKKEELLSHFHDKGRFECRGYRI